MDEILNKMKTMNLNEPAKESVIQSVQNELQVSLPQEYIRFLLLHNGGEGPIGEYGYLAVWSTDEILGFYHESGINNALTEFSFFASDRSGYLYAFDLRSSELRIVEIPEDIEDASEIKVVAGSFGEFIDYIYNIDDSEYEDILQEDELN